MKNPLFIIVFILITGLFCGGCSSSTSNLFSDILEDQTGTLMWGGSPEVDGAGILFETADTTYGAPGSRDDYSVYFPENENQVQIEADIFVTGETTIRGWGAEFPEIKFLRIERIE